MGGGGGWAWRSGGVTPGSGHGDGGIGCGPIARPACRQHATTFDPYNRNWPIRMVAEMARALRR